MWVKYRHNYAASYGKWEYKDIPYETTDEMDILDYVGYYELSGMDMYRGCEYEIIESPPEEVLQNAMLRLMMRRDDDAYKLVEYQKLLDKLHLVNL